MRKTTGTIVCPSCNRLIDVSEPRCPFCNMPQPGLWGYAPALRRVVGGVGDLSRLIITACVVLYVLALLIDIRTVLQPTGILGILAPSRRSLFILGMTGNPVWGLGHWWTVLSAIYLHGGLLHILFNMMWIRNLGPAVEDIYGTSRFFIIFTVAGAVGFLCSNIFSGAPTIGASGSIFGLMAALILHGRRAGRSLMTRQILTMAVLIFLLGFVIPRVNIYAHAGGFAGGWLTAMLLGAGLREREGGREQLLALGLLIGSVLAIVASILTILVLLAR